MRFLSIVVLAALAVFGSTAWGLDQQDPALVGVWLFDETEGRDVADELGVNNGRASGRFVWEAGKFGNAIVYTASGSINVPESDSILSIADQLTVAGWFRVDADSDTGVRKNGSFLLEDQSGSEPVPDGFSFRIWTDQGLSPGFYGTTELVQGEWFHAAGTYDGTMMELYINGEPESPKGVLDASGNDWVPEWGGEILHDGGPLQLKFGPETLIGGIDEVVVLNRAITADEVKQLMGGWASLGGAGVVGDINGDGKVDAADIDAFAAGAGKDLNGDGNTDDADRVHLVKVILNTWIGDANLDGEFNSTDFVQVFQVGEYEDLVTGNSSWAEGDWNGDSDFNSSDFVAAFQDGGFELGPRPQAAVPEPVSGTLLVIVGLSLACWHRRGRK